MSAASKAWIRSPLADLGWIILCPLLGWAAITAIWGLGPWSDKAVYAVVFGFLVTGHHMPGWFRAWGEPVIYDRYKARLWVSAFAIPALVIVPTVVGLGVVAIAVTACFDLWHVSMQQHGLGRIYGAKAGDRDRRSARTDHACVLLWYGTLVAWSDSWSWSVMSSLRRGGLPVAAALTPELWRLIQTLLLAASGLLLLAYLGNALALYRDKGVVAWRKHALHAVAFTVLAISYQDPSWYRSQSVQNIFHATQFIFLVWVFGRGTMAREGQRPKALYRRLFEKPSGLVPYGVLIAAYGLLFWAISAGAHRISGYRQDLVVQIAGSLGMASLLLHYYVDSFIWKVRSKQVQLSLAIAGAGGTAAEQGESSMRGAWHAVRYFGAPILLVGVIGGVGRGGGVGSSPDLIAHEATLFPRSAAAAYELGRAALAAGAPQAAAAALERARSLSPEFDGPAGLLADLHERRGDLPAAIRWSAAEVDTLPDDISRRFMLANRLAKAGQYADAERTYRDIVRREPKATDAWFNLGVMADKQGRPDEAKAHFERARELKSSRAAPR